MMTDDEYLDILQGLEEHHAIFYQLWEMGRPVFTDEVDTAAVSFELERQFLSFKFNPDFWDELDDYSRLFVIAHEALHVLLNHGHRSASPRSDADMRDLNVAMDVTVNTQLVTTFGFQRQRLHDRIAQNGCFKDTVFSEESRLRFQHFEHIYRQLGGVDIADDQLFCFDDHGSLDDIPEELVDDFCHRAGRRMSGDEVQEVNRALDESSAGDYTPLASMVVAPEEVEEDDRWTEFFDSWVRRNTPVDEIEDRWERRPRRLQSMGPSLCIPREHIVNGFDKPRVVFFVDTSGSCRKYARRFMRCVDSIPHHIFDVDLYCFDVQVYPVDRHNRKLRGFGGTSFHPLEYHLKTEVRRGVDYPQTVFVLTDGYGNPIDPAHPERWHWFLTEDGSDEYIPPESTRHPLAEFEAE